MKRLFLTILLVYFAIIVSPQIYQTIDIPREEIRLKEKGIYHKIEYGYSSYLDSIGYPHIPIVIKAYAIPLDAKNVSLQIKACEVDTLCKDVLLYPNQPVLPNNDSTNKFVNPDSTIYNQIDIYPHCAAEIIEDNPHMGFRIIRIAYYPFAYQPRKRTIYKRKIDCVLNFNSTNSAYFHAPKISQRRTKLAKDYISSIIENSSDIQNIALVQDVASRMTMSDLSIQKDVIPDYIIITNEELKSEFQILANWKTKKGIPTIIKTIENINSEYIGTDIVEKIRNFLIDFEERWGKTGLYILLGGDMDIIPTRKAKSTLYQKTYPTDAYYADFDFSITNWEHMNYRKGNSNRDVFIGRIPFSTVEDVRKYIQKLIHYEKASLDTDYSYLNNLLVSAAFMNPNNTDGHMEEFDIYKRTHFPEYGKHWYLFDHFNCDCHSLNYDKNYGTELNKENFLLSLEGEIPHGFSHIIFHEDHGSDFSFDISSKSKGHMVTKKDIFELEDSTHDNIIFTVSCNTANFSEDCIGENFLRRNTIAFVGCTDVGWRPEYSFLNVILSELYTPKSNYTVGYIHSKLIYAIDTIGISYRGYHRLHLLGDPEMPVWTNIPQNLNVSVSPANRIVASWQEPTTIKVRVNNLPAGETATVCIMKDTEVYKVMEISDTDEHRFQCTPLTAGTMHVTVTAHNFRPHETAIPVVVNAPTLSIHNVEFLSGNDGIISPGENVQLRVTLKNNGAATISSVEATMGTASPYITFVRDQLSCGSIGGGQTRTITNTFRFNVSADAPEILRNDFNGVTLHLLMDKGDLGMDVDTFRVDMLRPKYKFVSHKRTGSSTLAAGGTYTFTSEIINLGKIEATPRMEIIPETANVDTVIYAGNGIWRATLADNYQSGTSVKLKVNLYGNNILSDSQVIEMQDGKLSVTASSIGIHEGENSITLYWTKPNNAYGYHIYRSTTPTGTYTRMNKMPLTDGFFIDENLDANTTYYYKVSAVNQSMVEGGMSSFIKVHTLCGTMEGFPVMVLCDKHEYRGEATTVDFDYDGQQEIILGARYSASSAGKIVVLNPDATEPFDTDNDASTIMGYADMPGAIEGTPTVADIYGTGEPCIIASTRNGNNDDYVVCYSSKDENGDGTPDLLWQSLVPGSYYRSPVITDINPQDGKGEKEIIIVGDAGGSTITVLDCNGNIIHNLGNPNELLNYSVCTPAIADLDGDDYKEIVYGNGPKLYVWSYNGSSWNQQTLFTASGKRLESSPVICDFDNDGEKEVIVATAGANPSHIFAIKQDGTLLPGFDRTSTAASTPYANLDGAGLDHGVSVGDIDNDGNLEIVALGTDSVFAWNHDGTLFLKRYIPGLFPNTGGTTNVTTPILADITGDLIPEIIFHHANKIYALYSDGTDVKGFPLTTYDIIKNGVCISDIDGDLKNEIVAADNIGKIYAWKTNGHPDGIEWGRFRLNIENTSEYVSNYQDPWVITANTTWEGGTFTNDIIIRSGTFTIPQGVTLDMRKPYRIYVMNGGALNVIGGRITNADIVVKNGGTLNVAGNSLITLRSTGGNLKVEKGAVLNMPLGTIR